MPHVVNGIGTWYWGKRNMRIRRSVCRFCGHAGDLRSYDTTLFFVLVFVPLVPLSKKRIIDECPRCRKHMAAKMRKWEEGKQKALAGALETCESAPGDVEKATDAVAACVGYHDEESFNAVATILAEPLAHDAGFQQVLAEAHAFFGHHEESEAAFRRSLALRPDPGVQERLDVLLIRHGSVDEARPAIDRVLEEKDREKIGLVYLAVEACQAQGRHKDALELLERCAAAFPEAGRDKGHRRYIKTSKRHGGLTEAGTGKKIKSALITSEGGHRVVDRPWRARAAMLIAPALALIALAVYLGVAVSAGNSRKVWVVNGLGKPYTVEVGGKPVVLAPMSARQVRVHEGNITVKVTSPGVPIPETRVRIVTPFLSRPMLNRTFVINPDRVALVGEETALYSPSPGSGPGGRSTLHVGKDLYSFSGLDYEFTDFPTQVKTPKSTGKLSKRRVTLWRQGPVESAPVVAIEAGDKAAAERARVAVALEPENAEWFAVLLATSKPDEALATIKPLLARRPVLIEAHRHYQELMERAHPDHDLAAEYRALLAAAPGDAALAYLLGRVTPDRAEARDLWTKAGAGGVAGANVAGAAADNAARAYALGALAYDQNVTGRFEEALASLRQARQIDPSNASIESHERDTLHALGKFDEILAQARYQGNLDKMGPEVTMEKVYYTFRRAGERGGENGATALVERFATEIAAENSAAAGAFRNYAMAIIEYCKGNEQGLVKFLSDLSGDEGPSLDVAICAGKLDDAAKSAAAHPSFNGMSAHLLVYLAAMSAGDHELAEKELGLAAERLAAGGKEERQCAAWLNGTAAPKLDDVMELPMAVENKRILLSAMGVRYPELREACFQLAGTLNYDLRFPHLLLRKVLGR